MQTDSSIDLLERARAGATDALDALLARHAGRLLAIIRLRLGPGLRERLESRDILQATFLKALGAIRGFSGSDHGSLVAWLSRIAENEIRDQAEYWQRQRRASIRTVSIEDPAVGMLAARVRSQTSRIALDERLMRLERALEALTPDHREAIVLRKLQEMSFSEMGQRLGKSPDACRMLLARAMTALTLQMGEPHE